MAGIRRKLVNTGKEKEFHLKFLVRHGTNQRWDLTTRIMLPKAYWSQDKRVQRNHPDYGRYNEFIDRMEALVKLKAIELFKQAGVNVFVGAPQIAANELIEGYLNQSIQFNANYCDH